MPGTRSPHHFVLGLLLAAGAPAAAAQLHFPEGPLQPAAGLAKSASLHGEATPLQIDFAGLSAGQPGDRVRLPGTDGRALLGTVASIRHREDGRIAWVATVETPAGPRTALLVAGNGLAFGHVPQRDGKDLRIESHGAQAYLIEATTQQPQPPSGSDVLLPPAPDAASRLKRARQDAMPKSAGQPIDLLVLYTPRLVAAWGSESAVQARIAYFEEFTNQAFIDSLADVRVRLVAAHLVDYAAHDDNGEALAGMSVGEGTPLYVEAARLRQLYGADLVKLLREHDPGTQTSCGVGWLGGYHGAAFQAYQGFSITADRGFNGGVCHELTFPHEIGHNLGAHHDEETEDGDYGAFPYSRGYRRLVEGQGGFYTVMAYPAQGMGPLARFSNPRQSQCLGQPCGDAARADNARGLGQAAAPVAAFFPTQPADGPGIRIDDVVVTEGDEGVAVARFQVRLSAPAPAGGLTLVLATRPGSADADDFIPQEVTRQVQAGQSSLHMEVPVRGDRIAEPDESFSLNLISASPGHVLDGQGIATIINDDPLPALDIADASLTEGDAGEWDMVFTARLSMTSTQAVWFDAATSPVSGVVANATPGADYVPVAFTDLHIPPGQDYAQFAVPIRGDLQPEGIESFYVTVGNVRGAAQARQAAIGRIFDNDTGAGQLPTLTVSDASVEEGDAGLRDAVFTVNIQGSVSGTVRFGLSTQNGSALAGRDYLARAFTGLGLSAASRSVTVRVPVMGDVLDEGDETFHLVLDNVAGAVASRPSATATIRDDDAGGESVVAFVAREDRYELLENSVAETYLPVLANDVFEPARLVGGSLSIVRHPGKGGAHVDMGGQPGSAADDAIRYTPTPGAIGDDDLAYRLCEAGGRCVTGEVRLPLRPFKAQAISSPESAGFRDVRVSGLDALSGLQLESLAPTWSESRPLLLAGDPTPEDPWDLGGAGTAFRRFLVPTAVGTPVRLLAEAAGEDAGNVDLYLGLDANRNGQPDIGELACTAAVSDAGERCELDIVAPGPEGVYAWVMLHSPDASAAAARLDLAVFAPDAAPGPADIVATGPGRVGAGEEFTLRLGWDQPAMAEGEVRLGLVALRAAEGASRRWVPMRLERPAVADAPLSLWHADTLRLPGGDPARGLFVDVPEGASRLVVEVYPEDRVDVYLAPAGAWDGPGIDPAPPPAQARVTRLGAGAGELLVVENAQLQPGRWYLVPRRPGGPSLRFSARARVEGPARLPVAGSYYNPARAGHGLFFYPAGSQWAGLWYTYLQDGTPTWYYLQAAAPGPGDSHWSGAIYRARWNGTANALTPVGQATLTAVSVDDAIFSYRLDGEAGSERLSRFGAGCPRLGGMPVDASSHWFDPARAGTGYSVQLFPDYEFYAAFVYDGRGVARFLSAESPRFEGADAVLRLDQLTGFCPLCSRSGAPLRSDVGTLRRRFSGGTLTDIEIDALYDGGVPGAWTANDRVQLLGGQGTTQGCPAP